MYSFDPVQAYGYASQTPQASSEVPEGFAYESYGVLEKVENYRKNKRAEDSDEKITVTITSEDESTPTPTPTSSKKIFNLSPPKSSSSSSSKAPSKTQGVSSSKPTPTDTYREDAQTESAPAPSGYVTVIEKGKHCPYPYPGEHCGEEPVTSFVRTTEKVTRTRGWCPYPGLDC